MGGWDRAAPSRLVQPGPRDCLANPLEGGYSRPDPRAQGLQRADPPGTMHWLPAGNRDAVAGVLLITLTGWGLGLPELVRARARWRQRIPNRVLEVVGWARSLRALWPSLDPFSSPAR